MWDGNDVGRAAGPSSLSGCDSEPIQFLGAVQPGGFLVVLSPDWIVTHASASVEGFLGPAAEDILGCSAAGLLGTEAMHAVRGRLQVLSGEDGAADRLTGVRCGAAGMAFDLAVHRVGESIVIEGEPHAPEDANALAEIQPLFAQLRRVTDLDGICAIVARQVRAVSGYDRVMVYRFHPDGSGEVAAETRRAGLPAYLGLRYPATDIPQQARALYLRNPIRLIADVAAADVPVLPPAGPDQRPIDLSLSVLRAVSPVHIEYLRNMGVAASMSVSLIVEGRLWGLIACHHMAPRRLSQPRRGALELYGEVVSTMIESRLRRQQQGLRARSRQFHTQLLSQVSGSQVSTDDLFHHLEAVQPMLGADGMATFVDGRLRLSGETPATQQVLDLMRFLNGAPTSRVYCTDHLSNVFPPAAAYAERTSGLLAVPITRDPRDYAVFFRRELVRQVTWAGEPKKAVTWQPEGLRLSPRQSFEAWRETVRGQSAPWGEGDLETGEALRVTLLELMLQVTDKAEKQRKASGDQQDLLIAELNHRVRNILNLIVGLVRQCRDGASSVDQFAEDVSSRVHALARAHDQLTSSGWKPRSIRAMIQIEAAAYLGEKAERVIVRGGDAAIQPDSFATVALVMHELITNAAKYGAFRDSHGRVEVDLDPDAPGGLAMRWAEHGGAPVVAPTRRGFGSTIIERAIPYELGGTARLDFAPDGLRAAFTIPPRHVAEVQGEESVATDGVVPAVAPDPGPDRIEGSVLLLEDNILIALETEEVLRRLGAADVKVASTNGAALTHIAEGRPDFAVLDYNLGRERSVPVAERLAALGVPFVFATGYGDSATIDARFRDRPILTKPYGANAVLRAYQDLLARATADG